MASNRSQSRWVRVACGGAPTPIVFESGATGLSTRCTRPKSLSMSWASPTGGKCIVEFSNGGNRRFHGLSITRDVGAPGRIDGDVSAQVDARAADVT